MGYSICVSARHPKLQKAMLQFMEKEYRGAPKVFGYDGHEYASPPMEDLSYCSQPNQVGFDYNACDPEREYITSVTRWMAIKIGERDHKFHNETYNFDVDLPFNKMPFYFYDDEKSPIPMQEGTPCNNPVKDQYGCTVKIDDRRLMSLGMFFAAEKDEMVDNGREIMEVMRSEIVRLDELWSKREVRMVDASGAKLPDWATAVGVTTDALELVDRENRLIKLNKKTGKQINPSNDSGWKLSQQESLEDLVALFE
jgi:hypothetical protein